MIDRYPHEITFKGQGSAGVDENGDPAASADAWSDPVECRYETDGKSNIQVLKDGSIKRYAYVVYMGFTGENYDGGVARLYDNQGKRVCEGIIHHSTPYQLSTVLYIEKCL